MDRRLRKIGLKKLGICEEGINGVPESDISWDQETYEPEMKLESIKYDSVWKSSAYSY